MTPWLEDTDVTLYQGDCLEVLRELPDGSVHMCATSPPFYGLRDYGTGEWEGGDPDCDHPHPKAGDIQRNQASSTLAGTPQSHASNGAREVCGKCGARRVDRQIGLEETPDEWVARLVAVFREVRRVLRDDGTLWVEIGDSYAANYGNGGKGNLGAAGSKDKRGVPGVKSKDMFGQPWLLAFALRADGWYLRSEIIWARPNPMPESVTDRPTKSHSTVFLLTKQARYFYDADAIREQAQEVSIAREGRARLTAYDAPGQTPQRREPSNGTWTSAGANARSVWQIPTEPTPFAHFATWPQALVRRMVLAGTSERGCCPECGAPWARETSSELGPSSRKPDSRAYPTPRGDGGGDQGAARSTSHVGGLMRHVTTLGWSPSCDHHGYPEIEEPGTVPCTVLDPFAGSGTTNLVARNHGRHSIGIELNQSYLEIAARRLQQLSLLA